MLATVVKLLETTLIRVGNEEYARENHSYGLTTLKDRHAKIAGGTITFKFKGKSGKRHSISVHDPQLAKIVKQCQELPDQEIFAYVDEKGDWQDVKSQHVNEYLQEVTGESFTAKDFRTWSGTVLAAIALREFRAVQQPEGGEEQHQARGRERGEDAGQYADASAASATCIPRCWRVICRARPSPRCSSAGEGQLAKELRALKPEEAAVMVLLQERLKQAAKKGATKAKDLAGALAASVRKVQAGAGRRGGQAASAREVTRGRAQAHEQAAGGVRSGSVLHSPPPRPKTAGASCFSPRTC